MYLYYTNSVVPVVIQNPKSLKKIVFLFVSRTLFHFFQQRVINNRRRRTRNFPPKVFNIMLTYAEYASIGQMTNIGMKWTDVLYEKFHKIWPTCAIKFHYSHFRKGTRKRSTFWLAKASCTAYEDCIKVTFQIVSPPVENDEVPVTVNVSGTCAHHIARECEGTPVSVNRRPLTGSFRANVARQLLSGRASSQSLYHTKLADMSNVECNAGNTTVCQSPQIMRQASYEARRRTQLDRDVVTDLMMQREDWIASECENVKIPGFVQIISQIPFFFSFKFSYKSVERNKEELLTWMLLGHW